MERLKNVMIDPPGGWTYRQPETGVVCRGNTYSELLSKIRDHRKANELPIGTDFEREIQNAICQSLPPRSFYCRAYEEGDPRAPRRAINIDDVGRFLATMRSVVAEGKSWVSQEEAERRARICSTCPRNISISGCTSCRGVINWITGVIGKRRTLHDDRLKGCEVCGCELRTAVHVDLDAQLSAMSEEMQQSTPSYCWKRKEPSVQES